MRVRTRRRRLAVALAVLAACPPAATAGATDRDGIIRVAAIVTDRRGHMIAGLKPADFDLLVDGKPQAVEAVELSTGDRDTPRTFAFLLDEFHTTADQTAEMRSALLRFVDAHLRARDRVLVVKPLDPLTSIKPIDDRAAVRAAIQAFEGRKGDYTPRTAFERTYMAQAPSAVAAARAQIVTSALRAIGMSLATEPGRAAIVLVSDGFGRVRASREVPGNLQTVIQVVNRADAPVYAYAPSIASPPVDGNERPDPALAALTALTAHTGGALVTGTARFAGGLERMARELDARYLLTYQAAHGSDGRFHTLQVSVKRPDAQVRARTGYVAPVSAAMRAAATARLQSAPMRPLRRSPLIQAWSGFVPTTAGRAQVLLTWEPAPARAPAAAVRRPAYVVVSASGADGTVLFDAAVAPAGGARADEVDIATFEAPAGPVRVEMKILDQKGVVIDTDAREIVVPAPRKSGPTLYPPALLRAQTMRDFRRLSDDPHAAPAAAREFRRTERLIIRVSALDSAGNPLPVGAALLNRLRQPMRDIAPMERTPHPSLVQFDLPLASLPPGDYSIRLNTSTDHQSVSEFVSFRVVG